MSTPALELDLEVFQGPFDLLLALVVQREVDLLEVDLAEVVLAYIEHLERTGELDLEATTEFLVLIAALLEMKSRLMLPGERDEPVEPPPADAVDELLARMLEYRRYRGAAGHLRDRLAGESGFRYRSAPLPVPLRRVALETATPSYEPAALAEALGSLLRVPPPLDLAHLGRTTVTLEACLGRLRGLLSERASVDFDEAVAGADRLTEAVTLFALLELYRSGEADWSQPAPFGPITVRGAGT